MSNSSTHIVALLLLALAPACAPTAIDGDASPHPGPVDSASAADAGNAADAAVSNVDCEAIWQRPGHGTTFYEANPTYRDPRNDDEDWTVSTPGDQGMDATLLEAAATELAQEHYMFSLLVLRNGALVFERYFNGSDARASNNVHSASKVIIAALAGVALERGEISSRDQPLAALLPDHFAQISSGAKHEISIRHLLTMTAGLAWTEDVSEDVVANAADWVRAILALPLSDQPGQRFNYSTGQTHLLAAALTEATASSLCEFAHAQLFAPLAITAEHWGRDPQGYFSGGYNLYLTARELAKLGRLFLDDGYWNGRRILPDGWVAESVSAQQSAGDGYSYGYAFWLTELAGYPVHIAWGWGGQLVYIIPALDMVVVMTTNTRDNPVDFDGSSIMESYIIPAAE